MKTTRTSVRSDDGSPSTGSSCRNPSIGVAAAQAGSPSTSPSSVGASTTGEADAEGRGKLAIDDVVCAPAGIAASTPARTRVDSAALAREPAGRTVGVWSMWKRRRR